MLSGIWTMPRRQVAREWDADAGQIVLGVVDGVGKVRAERGWSGRVKSGKWFVVGEFARVRKMTMCSGSEWKRWIPIYSWCYWMEPFQSLNVDPRWCLRVKQCCSFWTGCEGLLVDEQDL